ncbi:hypothetical protein AVEN_98714-1 [Araneus ventricosus]|uniref:Uncharacterized protein n=1 Tax=Araneus ventricosus TaxID=182803 RepID=A0A4Y2HFX4_ARAVE|nr:hypothetical protein AVEN_98714-1 [Araneus ventricosus]
MNLVRRPTVVWNNKTNTMIKSKPCYKTREVSEIMNIRQPSIHDLVKNLGHVNSIFGILIDLKRLLKVNGDKALMNHRWFTKTCAGDFDINECLRPRGTPKLVT